MKYMQYAAFLLLFLSMQQQVEAVTYYVPCEFSWPDIEVYHGVVSPADIDTEVYFTMPARSGLIFIRGALFHTVGFWFNAVSKQAVKKIFENTPASVMYRENLGKGFTGPKHFWQKAGPADIQKLWQKATKEGLIKTQCGNAQIKCQKYSTQWLDAHGYTADKYQRID